ncbi:MAG: hypothetical protein QW480_01940 [Candidatus Aenigmatarchaeota archaeon]
MMFIATRLQNIGRGAQSFSDSLIKLSGNSSFELKKEQNLCEISQKSCSFLKESAEEGRYNKASVGEPCSARRLGHYLLLGSNIFKAFYKPCPKHRARVNTQRSKVEK